ncbi:hypothetical protein QFC21_000287 [Naganishia friedmannii]|uniref:Uncharacterized protein n=1 Tax=Naganishia friedmannii TaxID=89922 RepID=A0ACC2WCL4_9TREE|nr:hypothetical protein QFC21_000287 [Naganishia friedmannii]
MSFEHPTHITSRSHGEAGFCDSTDNFNLEHESSGLAIEKNEKTSWLNPTYKGSMPWGVQARLGTRPNTPSPSNPSSDHESSTTTAFAFAGSTVSLDKQQQSGLYLAPPLQRSPTSSSIEMPGTIRSLQRGLSSTDSLELCDSPLIVPLNFPSPPAKSNHFIERYTASQVTPPCLRPATPEQTEPAEPMTPTLDTPATGRFQTSSKSYPSPVQAGFRTPSSKYSVETQARRRDVSSSSYTAARTLTFDGNRTPPSDTSAIKNHTRTTSFGGAVFPGSPLDSSSPFSTRTQEAPRDAYRAPRRAFSYGLEVLEEPTHEAPISTGARGQDEHSSSPDIARFRGDASMSRWAQIDTPNETPNLSLSGLVSSPPSVDTGNDDNTVHTAVITPEDRHFPTISSPSRAMDDTWTPRGALGIGEGFGGGPQRDERGKKIDARRWRLADPLSNASPRSAMDVYTNDKTGKSKVGLKERFSQSVLNLLGDSKKGKARASERNLREPGPSQWPRKTTKAEKRKSVNDLLGPSAPRATYAWNDPVHRSAEKETPGNRARRIFFGRSDRNLTNRLRDPNPVDLPPAKMVKSGSAFFSQPPHSAFQPPPGMRKLPFSPSMPALSSSLNGRTASDIRIQTWLNTSQAALSEWEHARYDYTGVDAQRSPRVIPTPLAPYSFSRNAVRSATTQTNRFFNSVPPTVNAPVVAASHQAGPSGSLYHVLQPAPPPEEPTSHAKEGRRRSILLGVAQRKNIANVTGVEKQPKRRTTSINKLTSWLGFGRSKSSRTLEQDILSIGPVHPPAPSSLLEPNISQNTYTPSRSHYINARTGSSTVLLVTEHRAEQDDSAKKRRRRSGSDWFGSIVRRRTDKNAHPMTSMSPEIILLSAEHLPPPTIDEHGFLQSSPLLAPDAKLSDTYLALHGIRQAEQSGDEDGRTPNGIPSMAIQMERDLSRLTEGDEEGGPGVFSISPSPVITSEPIPATQSGHQRKPTPPFLDPWTMTTNSLAVPPFEMDRKRSKHIKRYPNALSIGSMSSLSTGITDGEEPAIISAIRSSPIHEHLPSQTAPTVARGVSLDLSALTSDERQAVGLGTTLHIPPITSTYPFPQAV